MDGSVVGILPSKSYIRLFFFSFSWLHFIYGMEQAKKLPFSVDNDIFDKVFNCTLQIIKSYWLLVTLRGLWKEATYISSTASSLFLVRTLKVG